MKKEFFIKHKNKHITITLKPKGFLLDGEITAIFDDCFEFKTNQATSIIEYEQVSSIKNRNGGD